MTRRISLLKKKGLFLLIIHWSSIRFPSASLLWPGHLSEAQKLSQTSKADTGPVPWGIGVLLDIMGCGL